MADIKNFSLVGVGTKLQLGKGGAKLFQASDAFTFKTNNEQNLASVSVASPTLPDHASTKKYVDDRVQGLDPKQSVKVATTANISLIGIQTIDGVLILSGDRVLVKDQSTASTNGIYVASSDAWSRSSDASGTNITANMFAFVEQGTIQSDTGWTLSTNDAIVLDTTPLTFTQFSSAGLALAGSGLTKTSNTFDVIGTTDRILVNSDNIDISPNYAGQSSIGTLGTITSGTWHGLEIDVLRGGTGVTSFTPGSLLIGNGSSALSTILVGPAGSTLKSNGTTLAFGTTALDDLNDVTITGPASGEAIRFNGTAWINAKLAASDITYSGGTVASKFVSIENDISNLSSSRIVDNKNAPTTMVATDELTGEVTIDAKGVGDLATRVASFKSGSLADTSFHVSNEIAGQVTIKANSTNDNANLRLVGHGPLGEVHIGNPGTKSMVMGDDDSDLTLSGGNSSTIGGNLLLRGGTGTDGSGDVVISNGYDVPILQFKTTNTADNTAVFTNGTGSLSFSAIGATINGGNPDLVSNIDLILAPQAEGKVSVSGAVVANVAIGVASDDAVNVYQLTQASDIAKAYTDSLSTSSGVSNKIGSLQTREIIISTASMNIGNVIKGHVRRVMLKINTAYSNGATFTVGRAGALSEVIDGSMIDESSIGLYDMNISVEYSVDTQLIVTVTGGPSTGAAVLVIEYIQA